MMQVGESWYKKKKFKKMNKKIFITSITEEVYPSNMLVSYWPGEPVWLTGLALDSVGMRTVFISILSFSRVGVGQASEPSSSTESMVTSLLKPLLLVRDLWNPRDMGVPMGVPTGGSGQMKRSAMGRFGKALRLCKTNISVWKQLHAIPHTTNDSSDIPILRMYFA